MNLPILFKSNQTFQPQVNRSPVRPVKVLTKGMNQSGNSKNGKRKILPSIQNGLCLEGRTHGNQETLPLINAKNSFAEVQYLERLRNTFSLQQPNHSKIWFLELGDNSVTDLEPDQVFIYIGHQDNDPKFRNQNDFNHTISLKIDFGPDLMKLCHSNMTSEVKKLGWIIIKGNKWGFLLDKAIFEEIKEGIVPPNLQKLLKFKFVKNLFESYSARDALLASSFLSENNSALFSKLLDHQKGQVNWMLDLEINKQLKIYDARYEEGKTFLGSAYCFDPRNPAKLVKKYTNERTIPIHGMFLICNSGSGKAVSTIALTAFKPLWSNNNQDPTLIIVPPHLLYQWEEDFGTFAPETKVFAVEKVEDFEILCSKKENCGQALQDFDVIIINRDLLAQNQVALEEKCPDLFQVHWKRIIMDEANEIISGYLSQKETQDLNHAEEVEDSFAEELNWSDFAKCLNRLKRDFTWGLTNLVYSDISQVNLNEVNCLFKLGLDQYLDNMKAELVYILTTFCAFPDIYPDTLYETSIVNVNTPQVLTEFGQERKVQSQKEAKTTYKSLLDDFSPIKNDESYIDLILNEIDAKLQKQIGLEKKKLSFISPDQINKIASRVNTLNGKNNFLEVVSQTLKQSTFECSICSGDIGMSKIVILRCLHHLCDDCYENMVKHIGRKCPMCKDVFTEKDLKLHPQLQKRTNKLTAILDAIAQTPVDDKIIIYSQFKFLSKHLSEMLKSNKINCTLLEEKEPSKIHNQITEFKTNPEIKVLLMSIEQRTTGLNLQEANHVFLVHSFTGLSQLETVNIYSQCAGAVDRIGQTKSIFHKLFVTNTSFEENYTYSPFSNKFPLELPVQPSFFVTCTLDKFN